MSEMFINEVESSDQVPDILLVDDTPMNLHLLSQMLSQCGYRARPVPSGKLALKAARTTKPDLVLLDISMPEMDGYEVCQAFKDDPELSDIPIIFISALTETIDKVRAFGVGGVDYVAKPFQIQEVDARVKNHLQLASMRRKLSLRNDQLEELVEKQVKKITQAQMGVIYALGKLAESRDNDTGKHIERVQHFCWLLADTLRQYGDYPEVDSEFVKNIYYASPLHDVGKVGISDAILQKPGRLTKDEFETMKTHAEIGAKTLEEVCRKYPDNEFLAMGIEIARSHHECWDGTGYPAGLAATQIPIAARIMSVVDVYDALRSRRCYKEPFTHEYALQIMKQDSGTRFDPDIIHRLFEIHKQFEEAYDNMTEA
jgi:putative two-component system response regulator